MWDDSCFNSNVILNSFGIPYGLPLAPVNLQGLKVVRFPLLSFIFRPKSLEKEI